MVSCSDRGTGAGDSGATAARSTTRPSASRSSMTPRAAARRRSPPRPIARATSIPRTDGRRRTKENRKRLATDAGRQDAAALQPRKLARATDRLVGDHDLRHRPAPGALQQQRAEVDDVIQRALLERDRQTPQDPASTRAMHAAADGVHDDRGPAHVHQGLPLGAAHLSSIRGAIVPNATPVPIPNKRWALRSCQSTDGGYWEIRL